MSRDITLPDGQEPECRADEVAFRGGSLFGYTNWLLANDEDFTPNKATKLWQRRQKRRRREQSKWENQ